jgi:hypothetical protein
MTLGEMITNTNLAMLGTQSTSLHGEHKYKHTSAKGTVLKVKVTNKHRAEAISGHSSKQSILKAGLFVFICFGNVYFMPACRMK